jgi:hypothetical protein
VSAGADDGIAPVDMNPIDGTRQLGMGKHVDDRCAYARGIGDKHRFAGKERIGQEFLHLLDNGRIRRVEWDAFDVPNVIVRGVCFYPFDNYQSYMIRRLSKV